MFSEINQMQLKAFAPFFTKGRSSLASWTAQKHPPEVFLEILVCNFIKK